MILSQTAIYALKATLSLAGSDATGPITVDEIARRMDVPRNYLSKILHALARGGVLVSTRGPGGGFRLAHPANEITLSAVIRHFNDSPSDSSCLLGRTECSDSDPCAAHAQWKDVATAVRNFFDKTSIAELAKDQSLAKTLHTG